MKYLIIILFTLGFISTGLGQVPNNVPTNGLIGWWPFNGNANDESGNKSNGIVTGATLTKDRFNKESAAYLFNGTSDYILIPKFNKNIESNFTISFWVKIQESDEFQVFLSKGEKEKGHFEIYSYGRTHKLSWHTVEMCSDVQSSFKIDDNQIHHIVAKQFNDQLMLYVDGQKIHAQGCSGKISETVGDLTIGRLSNQIGSFLFTKGIIDDIGIWNRALNDEEIHFLYSPVMLPNDSIKISINEGHLTATTKTNNTIKDIDGNEYHEVIVGNQIWLAENLKTTRFQNGDPISLNEPDSWGDIYEPSYWGYNNTDLRNKNGNLYNKYSISSSQKIGIAGWHIPTNSEWNELLDFLQDGKVKLALDNYNNYTNNPNYSNVESDKKWNSMKDIQKQYSPLLINGKYLGLKNKYDLNFPAGGTIEGYEHKFIGLNVFGTYWTSDYYNYTFESRNMSFKNEYIECSKSVPYKGQGYSIRLIKDVIIPIENKPSLNNIGWIKKSVTKVEKQNTNTGGWDEVMFTTPGKFVEIRDNKDIKISDLDVFSAVLGRDYIGIYNNAAFINGKKQQSNAPQTDSYTGSILLYQDDIPGTSGETNLFFYYNGGKLGAIEIRSKVCMCASRIYIEEYQEGLKILKE